MEYKEEDIVRGEEFTIGDVMLSRWTIHKPDGRLQQDLILHYGNDEIDKASWTFEPRRSEAIHLDMLDQHWEMMKRDLVELINNANFYNYIKEGEPHRKSNPLLKEFLAEISVALFSKKHIATKNFIEGRFDEDHSLVSQKLWLGALRDAIENYDRNPENFDAVVRPAMQLDSFEKNCRAVAIRADDVIRCFSMACVEGVDEGDLQLTAGGDDESNESWRDNKSVGCDETADSDGMPCAETDDVDIAGSKKLVSLMQAYIDHMDQFINAADKLWGDTFQAICENEPVVKDMPLLENMNSSMNGAMDASLAFQIAVENSSFSGQFAPVCEMLDNGNDELVATMKKLYTMASNPVSLKKTIQGSLNVANLGASYSRN